ncbi:sec-independent translocase [Luteococcus peritonei]|uniref:Sec-independent translocase n=1 Tax=Luteococcus peritonei TaxID=88874 RepID=A0ABW4RX52_9ACTN
MNGFGITEMITLAVLAVILFGPEKIPEFSRKAARVVWFLRNVANNAQTQLRNELGPEYADLDIRDLTPKNLIQKHLLDEIQSDIDEIKADLSEVRSDLDSDLKDAQMLGEDIRHQLEDGEEPELAALVPFDVEAT